MLDVDCFNGAILIFLQSIDVSVHVTSDQKVCLFCYFNEILLVSSSNCFFFWVLYRKKYKGGLVCGMVYNGHVTYLQENFIPKLWISCCIFSPTIQQFELGFYVYIYF